MTAAIIKAAADHALALLRANVYKPGLAIHIAAELYEVDHKLVAKELNRRALIVKNRKRLSAKQLTFGW